MSTSEWEELKLLKRELKELQRERDPAQGVGIFRSGGARPPTEMMVRFIDEHHECVGVESICRQVPIALSTYYERKRQGRDPERRCARLKRDERLGVDIERVHEENFGVYGVRKVWR